MRKIILLVEQEWIAPRFDHCQELVIAHIHKGELLEPPRNILLGNAGVEKLLDFILQQGCSELICGAIMECHYNFLLWKQITVADFVVGSWQSVLKQAVANPIAAKTVCKNKGDRDA